MISMKYITMLLIDGEFIFFALDILVFFFHFR